jgi:predicted acetyltransferase
MRPLPSPFLELEKRSGGLGMEIDVGNETSVWEEDDDEEGMGGLVGSLRSRLHIRSSSAQEEVGGELGVKVRQRKRMKRSLSEVVKGVFRVRRKGGTL